MLRITSVSFLGLFLLLCLAPNVLAQYTVGSNVYIHGAGDSAVNGIYWNSDGSMNAEGRYIFYKNGNTDPTTMICFSYYPSADETRLRNTNVAEGCSVRYRGEGDFTANLQAGIAQSAPSTPKIEVETFVWLTAYGTAPVPRSVTQIGEYTGEIPPAFGGDLDGDGVPDASDNCPFTPNPGQEAYYKAYVNPLNPFATGTGDACNPAAILPSALGITDLLNAFLQSQGVSTQTATFTQVNPPALFDFTSGASNGQMNRRFENSLASGINSMAPFAGSKQTGSTQYFRPVLPPISFSSTGVLGGRNLGHALVNVPLRGVPQEELLVAKLRPNTKLELYQPIANPLVALDKAYCFLQADGSCTNTPDQTYTNPAIDTVPIVLMAKTGGEFDFQTESVENWVDPVWFGYATELSPYQGWWWDDALSGSGLSVGLSDDGENLFLAWYVYEASGNAVWYVAWMDKGTGDSYSGDLLRFTGAAPYQAGAASPTAVGTATITFSSIFDGTFSWDLGSGNTGSSPISKYMPDLVPGGEYNYRDAMQGWFTASGQPGMGFFVEVYGDTVFVGWYHYREGTGEPAWRVLGGFNDVGAFGPTETAFSGPLLELTNGWVPGQSYQAASILPSADAGTISILDDTVTISWTPVGGEMQIFTLTPFAIGPSPF